MTVLPPPGAVIVGSDEDRAYCARRGARLDERARRRARTHGGVAEHVALLEVLDRDAWLCGICLGAIDPASR